MGFCQTPHFFLSSPNSTRNLTVAINDITVEKIIRSRRRSIALIITPDGHLIVRAPLKAPAALIEEVVLEKRNWMISLNI